MSAPMTLAFMVIPMLSALWAAAGLRTLVGRARELAVQNADSLVPLDEASMDRSIHSPMKSTLEAPRTILATVRFVATPQAIGELERLRRRYLVRLLTFLVSFLASIGAIIVLAGH
jgi:hypothetical protein